jgi:hypothetical protein
MAYSCSLCGQTFLLPEDLSPEEGKAELQRVFQEHIREEHPQEAG